MSKPKVYRQINPELPTPKRDKSGLAILIPHKHGHANNKAPVGLLNLPKIIKYLILIAVLLFLTT